MYQLNTVSFHPIITRKLPGISEERSYEFTVTYELLFKKCILIFNVLITFFFISTLQGIHSLFMWSYTETSNVIQPNPATLSVRAKSFKEPHAAQHEADYLIIFW